MRRKTFDGGVCVSVLGIGCGRVGSISNPVPPREVEATLEDAVAAGISLFDTADIYGQGDSERALGRLLARHPDRMFVVTKVGGRHARYSGLVRLAKPALRALARKRPQVQRAAIATRTATVTHEFMLADLDGAIDASRRRLALDQLHGLLLHNPSLETLRRPEIHDFLAEVLRTGRAQQVGVSVDSVAAVEAAVAMPMVTMVQTTKQVSDALVGSPTLDWIRERKTGVFVREILRSPGIGDDRSPRAAFAGAIAPDFVTAAIVGVSTRQHLSDLLASAK